MKITLSSTALIFMLLLLSRVSISQNCEIFDLTGDILDCINGEFFISLDFESNNTSDSFVVQGNGNNYGNYSYSNVPLLLGPLSANGTNYEFVVSDILEPNCSDFIIPGVVFCDTPQCAIFDLTVVFIDCTSDSTYEIIVDFEHVGTGGLGFDLWANGEFFGFYSYSDLPLTISDFPLGDGMLNGLLVCDNDNPNCCEDASWPTPDCGQGGPCLIDDVIAEIFDCANGEFFVDIDFTFANTGDSFRINGNGIEYGHFAYSDIPITLGPLPENMTAYEFVVIDNSHMNCQDFVDVGVVSCDTNVVCELFDLVVRIGDCTSDSTYSVFLNFQHSGTTNNFFDLFANGNFFGFYEFDDLPLVIPDFPLSDAGFNFLTVCENDNPNCCAGAEWPAPDCPGNMECDIDDLEVEEFDCANGMYYLEVDFEYTNTGDSFRIAGNGNNYGHFAYADLPVIIGPLSINMQVNELVIIDLTHPNCAEDTGLRISCGGICELGELTVEVGDILSDTTFELSFDFDYANTSDSFDAYSGVMYLGRFAYADLAITIAEFPSRGLQYELLRVCDAEFPDCCAVVEFMVSDGSDCQITDPTAEVIECSGDTVFVAVDFNVVDGSSAGFEIVGNGNHYGQFDYDDLPVIISFVYDTGDFVDLIIRDLLNPNCLNYTYIDEVNCDGTCSITELNTDVIECTSDSTYNVIIDFDHSGTNGLGFDVFANGSFFGFYSYDDLPVLLEDFPSQNNQVDLLQVCENDNPNCCARTSVIVPDCITGLDETGKVDELRIFNSVGQWQIQVSEPGMLAIFDISGRPVVREFAIQHSVKQTDLASGIYIITWSGWWGTVSKRAIFIRD